MYQLICEGSCNPGIEDLTAETRPLRERLDTVRRLTHTPHDPAGYREQKGITPVYQVLVRCTVCQHGRVYGNTVVRPIA